MKRTLAVLLMMAHMGLLTGAVLSPHRGASGDRVNCHVMNEPVTQLAVGPATDCLHCPVDDCAGMVSCATTVTAMVATAHVPFVEAYASAWDGEQPSREITAAVPPILPPPRA